MRKLILSSGNLAIQNRREAMVKVLGDLVHSRKDVFADFIINDLFFLCGRTDH
jgi:hypothetical protein